MAVKNSLMKSNNNTNTEITYDANGEKVKLSASMIKNYLVNGNGAVTLPFSAFEPVFARSIPD